MPLSDHELASLEQHVQGGLNEPVSLVLVSGSRCLELELARVAFCCLP